MTKSQLIKEIQLAEARAWQTLQSDKNVFGEDCIVTQQSRNKWGPIYELRIQLGIEGLAASDMLQES